MSGKSPLKQAPPLTTLVWDPAMLAYDFGPTHPMAPARLELTAALSQDLGLLFRPNVTVLAPEPAGDEELLRIHSAEYIAAVRRISADPALSDPRHGLGTEDDPTFPGMHEAAARLAGGSLLGARRIVAGESRRALNFGGGMHHAMREKASGFCIYNDAALAIQEFLDAGYERVLYLDVDAHHGDGTESIFYNDSRVLTISLHESGKTLFPGTGYAADTGGKGAPGSAVNIPLPAGTGDPGWLRAFHAVVPAIVREFRPQVIVSQHGADSHVLDPLSNLKVSVEAQRELMLSISAMSRQFCEGKWLATGGGGYDVFTTVPRAWAHLVAVVSGSPVSVQTQTPEHFTELVRQRFDVQVPPLMGDGVDIWWRSWETGYDPSNMVDQSILAVRKEVFPFFGLDPWFD